MKIVRPFKINDTALMSSNVADTDYAPYLAATDWPVLSYVTVNDADLHKNYQALKSPKATVTLTVGSPCMVGLAGHGLLSGAPVSFATSGTLPTGIAAGTVYYVLTIASTDLFALAATPGGAAIATTGTSTGTHTMTVRPATASKAYWLDCKATNRWKNLDGSISSQTVNADSIVQVFKTIGRNNAVVILNASAATVRVTMTDDIDGVVYDKTVNMVSFSGINNLYAWYVEPIRRRNKVAFTDLPPYSNATITVTLSDPGNIVRCGACIIGSKRDIGATQFGAKVGIVDYSVKTTDRFGNQEIIPGEFSSRCTFSVWVDAAFVDELSNLLAEYRGVPIVYLGSEAYDCTIIYGPYKDFSIDITYDSYSVCSIENEGLT